MSNKEIQKVTDIVIGGSFTGFFHILNNVSSPSFSFTLEGETQLVDINKKLGNIQIKAKDNKITIQHDHEVAYNRQFVSDFVNALNLCLFRLAKVEQSGFGKAQVEIKSTSYKESFEMHIPPADMLLKILSKRLVLQLLKPGYAFGIRKYFNTESDTYLIDIVSYNIYKSHIYDSVFAKEASAKTDSDENSKTDAETKSNITLSKDKYLSTDLVMLLVYLILYAETKNKVYSMLAKVKAEQTGVMQYVDDKTEDLYRLIRAIISNHPLATPSILRQLKFIVDNIDRKKLDKITKVSPTQKEVEEVGKMFGKVLALELISR